MITRLFLKACVYPFIIFVTIGGCGGGSSNRETTDAENEASTEAQDHQLKKVVGRFEGQIVLAESRHVYDAVLEAKIVYRIQPSPQDPTINMTIPKLSGTISFPKLAAVTSNPPSYVAEISNPLGGLIVANFDWGDYQPHSGRLNLPYSVPEFGNEVFGTFEGDFKSNLFVGKWTSRIQSLVGTFHLSRVND